MSTAKDKIAAFIDGANLYASTKPLGFDVDYKKLREFLFQRGFPWRISYYTSVVEGGDDGYSSIRPLLDWLAFNGFSVIEKLAKEYVDSTGQQRIKGNMNVEIAVDMMSLVGHVEQMYLFSGNGDFEPVLRFVRSRGVRVTVISTLQTKPQMVSDGLRREADEFLDLVGLIPLIGRNAPARTK